MRRKYLYLISAFIVVELAAIYLIHTSYLEKKEQILTNASNLVSTEYNTIYNSFEKLANTVYRGYINKPNVIADFAARNREKLYNDLKNDYRYLKSIGFRQIHFHLPNNESFLRMHKPNKFGDNLTKVRYSVDYVNTMKKPIQGLEMGKIIPGFRYVYPLTHNNTHIGSVETSFGVYTFARQMEKVYKVHTHFLINKNIIEAKLFKDSKKRYRPSIEHKDYLMLKRSDITPMTNKDKKLKDIYQNRLKNIIDKGIESKEIFSLDFEIIDNKKNTHKHKIITFLPLKNIQNHEIGYFVVYQDDKLLVNLEDDKFLQYSIATIIILLIFILLYKELNKKIELSIQVEEKTKKLRETTRLLEEQTAELEDINDSLEDRIALEIEKNAKQEREIFQQSKQAALGDMIGNIAHQWRQPLSAISTSASGMQLTYQFGTMSDEDFINFTDAIIENSKYLSRTIDDFRDFISNDKKLTTFDISKSIEKCLAIVDSSINNHHLHIIKNLEDDLIVQNYNNELQQAIINIFTNAKDALKEHIQDSDDRIVFIDTFRKDGKAIITIQDTAGGISEDIIEKIFEPYFTTKHQSQGTGLGLYMTHKIIVESMKGQIGVENITFTHNDKSYTGAKFTISLILL